MSINQRAKDMWVEGLVRENRKLKSDIEDMDKALLQHIKAVTELQDKIKKLKEENEKLSEENGQLKEKIETLELRLDNKEKLNEEYRKQLDYRHHRAMKAERWWEDDN